MQFMGYTAQKCLKYLIKWTIGLEPLDMKKRLEEAVSIYLFVYENTPEHNINIVHNAFDKSPGH